ncbi:UbiX family flavin prenyltransferase [Ktedonospora formicarum]|uniref:Flavin prenyltransferase UbiX n=1 Tax=Ktedonospora formicarum TaxID=2778364 RepID=A0A8J3MYI8_9CHLR|nr:UbiX family flavin prenyltransferase [Ktedonospora formicarum]GHO50996.1 putative UbiX-like flavin prenyltransferase [Ktedonospora formicarum]
MKRLIVGMSGASGAIIGIRLLETLHDLHIETHLILTKWAEATIKLETWQNAKDLTCLATTVHSVSNQAATISSGSFVADGMIIVPCSMKTLAHIRHGLADDLLCRAADVTLKEKRKLVLVTREMPLSEIHLENMLALARMGAVILPPMLTFYNHPQTLDDMINHVVARTLDQFGFCADFAQRWEGVKHSPSSQQQKETQIGI